MPQKYRVTTEDGAYDITVDEPETKASPQTDSGALGMAAVKPALSGIGTAAEEIATNPNLVKAGKMAGNVVGFVKGVASKNPFTMLGSMEVGAKVGAKGAKIAQSAAGPIANVLDKAAPYAQAASTLGGAAGVGDLAQMAEPNRKDIGFLGVGPSVEVPGAHPPVINDLLARLRARISGR